MTSRTIDKMTTSRTAADIKVDIEFNSLKDYIRNIKSQLPTAERFLIAQWLKKLKYPQTRFRADYISRFYAEIVHGYLCPPFSSEPPTGELEPLPPPHTHTSSECCTSLSSIVTNNTSFHSIDMKNTVVHGEFSGGNGRYSGLNGKYSGGNGEFTGANGELSDETPTSSDAGDVTSTSNEDTVNDEAIVRVRSEPNLIKSKFHLASRYSRPRNGLNDGIMEEENEHDGNVEEKGSRGDTFSTKDYEHEFQSKNRESPPVTDNHEFKQEGFEKRKPEDTVKIGDGLENEKEMGINKCEEEIKETVSFMLNSGHFDSMNVDKAQASTTEDSLEKIFEKLAEEQLVAQICTKMKPKDGGTCKKTSIAKVVLEKREDFSLPTVKEVREVLREMYKEPEVKGGIKRNEASSLATVEPSSLPIGKEVREVFMNKKYGLETTRNSLEPTSTGAKKQNFSLETSKQDSFEQSNLGDKKHVQDVIKKIANLCQKRHQDRIKELEEKIANLIAINEELTNAKVKDNTQIEELHKELDSLKIRRSCHDAEKIKHPINDTDELKEVSVTNTIRNIPCKDASDNSISKGNEQLADIIDTLSVLLEKSNRHIEKLSSLAVKFNLIKSDYELERKEMILKFKSIDSLHQNILTELVKQRVNEGKEYEDLIDKYRAQFKEKNAEISKLQNTTCDACAKRRNEVTSGNKTNDGDTIDQLRKEVVHLSQVNKELTYTYEKKIKKLMNEKNLEGKLMNTLLKAQKEEIEIYLTGQKHEELRRLAENLESQYSRIVDDAIRVAKSQHETENGTK
ncbi:hypothetical protein WDU94_000280 [Cyamophila willieti]